MRYNSTKVPKTERITKLIEDLYAKMPEIESARARLLTESFRQTEGKPLIMRKALSFAHILKNIPIIIRENELIVGKNLAEEENYTIGDKVDVYGKEFKITGIYETGSIFYDSAMYTGLSKLQNLTDNEEKISSISIKIKKDANLTTVNDKIKNEYALSHNILLVRIPYWERDKITLDMILGSTYEVREAG